MTRTLRAVVLTGCLGTAAMTGVAGKAAAQPTTWNFVQADIPAAQSLGKYGKGVLVAVVDTWVDPTQPEFGGRVVDEADCLPGSCQDHRYAPDSCVHGTHVAGTVASADYGVAPEADILAVQVLSGPVGSPDPSASCSGSTSTVAAGIDYAVSKGARVINLSVGDEVPGLFQSAAISDSVSNAARHGVVVVFAAGNQGVPLTDSYGKDALLVAATGPGGRLAGYSNFNTALTGSVNVAAPGGDSGNGDCTISTCVLSAFPGKGLGLLEGTSMAAPHVSGLAALLLAQRPERGVSDVFSVIESTARSLPGAGAGLIDAGRALRAEPPAAAVPAASTTSTGAGRSSVVTAVSTPPPVSPALRRHPTSPSSTPSPTSVSPARATRSPDSTQVATGPVSASGAPQRLIPGISPRSTSSQRRGTSGWVGRNAVILVVASLLVAADVALVVWRRHSLEFRGRRRPS